MSSSGAKKPAAKAAPSGGSGNGSISDTALKLKHVKGIHEDDGDDADDGASDARPLDAQVMALLLESMGADKHEPRVVDQLQEFVHRYVTDILIDAQEYAAFADKPSIDADDVRIAIASRLNHHYTTAPSRELMMELAEKRNAVPLPPISNEYGVRLPPVQHQLVTYESERNRDEASLTADDSSAYDEPMPLQRLEGSRNKKTARRQIAIRLSPRVVNKLPMWSFHAYEPASRPAKTFDVDDFLGSLFRPQDAFVHAASLNQIEVVRRWIFKQHDINALDKEGHSALCMAAQSRCMEVLLLLLESGVNIDQQQTDGKTALHVACTWGRFDATTLLLEHGASVTRRDQDGQVPLHGACKNGHDRIVELLLDTPDMDPFVADELGATPFDLARDWQRLEILRILNEYHATRFTPKMQSRVQFVFKHTPSSLPLAMQKLVASFLC